MQQLVSTSDKQPVDILQWVFEAILFHESLVNLTHLTQPPFRLCHHTASNPEKLLCKSGDGCFLPEFWGAHNRRVRRIQGIRGLFCLMRGALTKWGGEHSCWQRSYRLKGGLLGWQRGRQWAATKLWRKRRHRWSTVHTWTVHVSSTLLSHSHHLNPLALSLCWTLQPSLFIAQLLSCRF